MDTNRQRFFNFLTTARAILRRIAGVDFDYLSSGAFCLVRKELKEFTPAHVSNALAKMPVPDHASNIQRFNVDGFVDSDVEIGNFMQKVFSLIYYLFVNFSHKDFCLSSSSGTSYFAGQCPLSSSQDLLGVSEEFRVFNTSACGVNEKCFDADINADFGNSVRHFLSGNIITGEAHKPFAGRGAADRDGFDIAFNRPGEEKFESADTSDVQVPAFNFVSGLLQGEGIVSVFPPKSWESGLFCLFFQSAEECVKGFLQSLYHILQNLRAYGLELKKLLLKSWKLILLGNTGDRFSMLPVDADSLLKSKIVQRTAYIKPLKAINLSLFVYYRSILECSSHFFSGMRQCFVGQVQKLKGQSLLLLPLMH